ncbi:hypothetical protein K439DRAFT_1243445, partial [Ramaria rubella]
MTDYGCQGRTRPNNVVDLGGCLTHQSYYTSLSRSASASGTVILQNFEPNKIMGRASGWLRQEFRELEILDEITKLRYDITGDRRNTIIREYQLWKGTSSAPKHVHAALCWSNDDPFPLLEVTRDADWYIHNGVIDRHSIEHNRSQTKKMKSSHIEYITAQGSKPLLHLSHDSGKIMKIKRLNELDLNDMPENTNPLGVQWNSTISSCAYDALFMIMHTLW